MTREVDIKALVSHVVKGDGINKCRICMGDTSEGQVYLGDTVMMDGDKPITLSEVLEAITGVEMQWGKDLPAGLCSSCSTEALNAAHFRTFCRQASEQWETTLQLLGNLHFLPTRHTNKAILIILGQNEMTVIDRYPGLDDKKVTESVVPKAVPRVKFKRDVIIKGCQCSYCEKKFKYPQQLHQHLKESTDFVRACHICAKIMSRGELVLHMKEVHARKPYDCKKCPALLHSYSQFKRHLIKAHSKGSCFCGDCGRSFKSSQGFHAHQSVHNPKTCPGCDKLFRNQRCYFYHVKKCCDLGGSSNPMHRTKHKVFVEVANRISDKKIKVGLRGSADKECICDYCGKKYAGKKFVAAHIQIVHTKNTHRPCVYCGKLLAAAHMTEHVKKHEIVSIFRCEHCGVSLRTKLGYIQHLRLHTGEKPYKCQYCGETFSASSRKSEHIRKFHKTSEIELKHACELCPARFRLPYRLKKHMNSVHADSDDQMSLQFECEECHEKFGSYQGLLHHSRKHQHQFAANRRTTRDAKFNVSNIDKELQTSVEEKVVREENAVPRGACRECYQEATAAYRLRQLVRQSAQHWTKASDILVHVKKTVSTNETYCIYYGEDISVVAAHPKTASDTPNSKELTISNAHLKNSTDKKRKRRKKRIGAPLKCCDCNKVFPSSYHLNEHFKSSMKRVCTLCSRTIRKEKLANHLVKTHKKKVISCRFCHKMFFTSVLLVRHVEMSHGPNAHNCKICGTGFPTDRALRAHGYTHSLFTCSACGATFENCKCYKYHKSQCKGQKIEPKSLYECHDCGIVYAKKPSLRIHIIQKHLNVLPYICQVCGKRTSNASHAKAHEATHLHDRKIYQCHCGAKMRTQVGFEMHKRIHTGEKPYECAECGDRFISASRRLDHIMRRHRSTKDMKHGCKDCSARFLRPFELKKHQMNVHGVES